MYLSLRGQVLYFSTIRVTFPFKLFIPLLLRFTLQVLIFISKYNDMINYD